MKTTEYSLTELKRLCGKLDIRPLISPKTGLVSFEAYAGQAVDQADGQKKKLRQSFGEIKYGSVEYALEAAKNWLTDTRHFTGEQKSAVFAIPAALREQVLWALGECERFSVPFRDVFDAGLALKTKAKLKEELTLREAAARMIEEKRPEVSTTYFDDMRFFFASISQTLGDHKIYEIGAEEIEDWLEDRELAAVTWNNKLRMLNVLWNHGLERRNGWVSENVILEIRRRNVKHDEVEVLTIPQVNALLKSASMTLPNLVPYLVIGLFCGLRPSEIQRTDWSDIDWETNSLRVRVTKSRASSSRYVHLEPVAVDWLKPIARPGGPVCDMEGKRWSDLKQLRAMTSNFDGHVFRHCFGTYHYRAFNDPQRTIVEMGHTTVQMLYKHYRRPVPQTTAAEYWKLTRSAVLG
jgi:integrase